MPNSMVDYKIKGDFDNELFEITIKRPLALLTVKKSLDYETTKFYSFILEFYDRNDLLLPESWNVLIVETKTIEPKPNQLITLVINENTNPGKLIEIGTMPNSMVGYKINGDFDNELFEISIRHPYALLEVKKSLDYETTKFYSFILQFSDRNDILLPESWNVTLVIEDFNDNKPVINKESLSASVYRNASEGTKFHTITGSDADSDLNFYNKLRFYKKPNSENPVGSRFSVSENGDVTVKSSLLNEMNDEITFQVFVRDMNGSVDGLESDFANMSVTILGEKSKANRENIFSFFLNKT